MGNLQTAPLNCKLELKDSTAQLLKWRTINTCIVETREARRGGRLIKCQGWSGGDLENWRVNCVTGESGFQLILEGEM